MSRVGKREGVVILAPNGAHNAQPNAPEGVYTRNVVYKGPFVGLYINFEICHIHTIHFWGVNSHR